MAYLGDIIRTLKNGMTSMNEGVNAVDRIQKTVPQSMLSEYASNVHWNDECPSKYNSGVSGMTWAQVMVNRIRESMRSGDGKLDDKFAPGFFRILLTECGFDFLNDHRNGEQEEKQRRLEGLYRLFIEDSDADKALMSYNFVPMVQTKSGPKAKNGAKAWTYEDFENVYGKTLDDRVSDDRRKASEAVLVDHGYKVIEIKNFKMAKEYGVYTGGEGGRSKLCYTQSETTMKGKFGGFGRNRLWLAYKSDFKKIEPVAGEGNPYDEYGLSMIWVFVAPNGSMPYVNVRWNHENSGAYSRGGKSTDHCLSMAEVVEITGHDFKTTFLPYKVEEKEEIDRDLGNGLNVVAKRILRDGKIVGTSEYNICHDGNAKDVVLLKWVDWIDDPEDGFVRIEKDEKYNMFDLKTNELLFPEWFDHVYPSKDGLVSIVKDGKGNLFDLKTKEFVLPEWFDSVNHLKDGFARVEKDEEYNLLDLKTKKFMLPEWFSWIDDPKDGFVKVEKDRKQNLLDLKTKEIVLPEWFDFANYSKDGFVEVRKDEKHNLFDLKTNELVLPEWVDNVDYLGDGLVRVIKDVKCNLFNLRMNKFVLPEWVGRIDDRKDGFIEVVKNRKHNLFDLKTNELVLPEWVDLICDPEDGFAKVSKDREENLFDFRTKKLVLPEWFDWIDYPKDGFIKVSKDWKYNLFDLDTKAFMFSEWLDGVDNSEDGFAKVRKDRKRNLFDTKTKKLVLPEWVDYVYQEDGFIEIEKDGKCQKIKLSDLRKTESRRRRCEYRRCECCGRRIHRRK